MFFCRGGSWHPLDRSKPGLPARRGFLYCMGHGRQQSSLAPPSGPVGRGRDSLPRHARRRTAQPRRDAIAGQLRRPAQQPGKVVKMVKANRALAAIPTAPWLALTCAVLLALSAGCIGVDGASADPNRYIAYENGSTKTLRLVQVWTRLYFRPLSRLSGESQTGSSEWRRAIGRFSSPSSRRYRGHGGRRTRMVRQPSQARQRGAGSDEFENVTSWARKRGRTAKRDGCNDAHCWHR